MGMNGVIQYARCSAEDGTSQYMGQYMLTRTQQMEDYYLLR